MTDSVHSRSGSAWRFLLLAALCIAAPGFLAAAPPNPEPPPNHPLEFSLLRLHPVLAFQDLDGDQVPEAVVVDELLPSHHELHSISVYLSASNRFGRVSIPSSLGATSLRPRDVDGDHDLDLVLMRGLRNTGAVLLNDGSGGFHLENQSPSLSLPGDDDDGSTLQAPVVRESQPLLFPLGSDPVAVGPPAAGCLRLRTRISGAGPAAFTSLGRRKARAFRARAP